MSGSVFGFPATDYRIPIPSSQHHHPPPILRRPASYQLAELYIEIRERIETAGITDIGNQVIGIGQSFAGLRYTYFF